MSIGNVTDYSSILQNYKIPVMPQSAPIVISDVQQEKTADMTAADIRETAFFERPARRDAKLEDISITFNKQDSFEYVGQDSDIRSLDMERAISDMKKDQVLQQYQYFVGSVRNLLADNADGVVFAKY